MMANRGKYPDFERVTGRRLKVGDRILVRERQSDAYELDDQDEVPWAERRRLPTGIHEITNIDTELHPGWKRASRYYRFTFATDDPEGGGPLLATTSAVVRWNRVIEEEHEPPTDT